MYCSMNSDMGMRDSMGSVKLSTCQEEEVDHVWSGRLLHGMLLEIIHGSKSRFIRLVIAQRYNDKHQMNTEEQSDEVFSSIPSLTAWSFQTVTDG